MEIFLKTIDPWAPLLEVHLKDLPADIGSAAGCQLRLRAQGIQPYHCEIQRVGDRLFLTDLGTNQGTLLNGKPIQRAQLFDGDEVTLGIRTFAVQITAVATSCQATEKPLADRQSGFSAQLPLET